MSCPLFGVFTLMGVLCDALGQSFELGRKRASSISAYYSLREFIPLGDWSHEIRVSILVRIST